MKRPARNVAREIIEDLQEINDVLRAQVPLHEKFTVRTVRVVPEPGEYSPADIKATRQLVGVSQAVFARMMGVSTALVGAWEIGQRKPSAIARRLLDTIQA